MLKRFSKYVFQSVAGMIGISVYVLADTFFISVYAGADGLAVLNLILPVYGVIYAIGSMIGIGSATRYGSTGQKEKMWIATSYSLLDGAYCAAFLLFCWEFLFRERYWHFWEQMQVW